MARAGFGLLSVLLSLLVIGLLGAVALNHYWSVTRIRAPAAPPARG